MATIIRTYDEDMYFIEDKTPDEVSAAIQGHDLVRMPNGDMIARKNIKAIQNDKSHQFQVRQKERHKRGQYILGEKWYDKHGVIEPVSNILAVKGSGIKQLESKQKKLT